MILDLAVTSDFISLSALAIFVLSYIVVIFENPLALSKSKPVVLAAGLIWILVAIAAKAQGVSAQAQLAVRENLLEFSELLLFLLVAMTYVNALEERKVFAALKSYLVAKQYSYRLLFWLTGLLAFVISPIADNLTTALVMCAIVMALGKDQPRFVALSCINIVVASNAGGAFSPFGDITTLMVWQKGVVDFALFFRLFFPALLSFVLTGLCLHWALPTGKPPVIHEQTCIQQGGIRIALLFLATIITSILCHHFYALPPTIGMMMGLAYINFLSYYLKLRNKHPQQPEFNVFENIKRIEWDTLLFFYGVLMSVGGLAALGYLDLLSDSLYTGLGQTQANISMGLLSAIVDNIPLMYAVLTMEPAMSQGQWLLITLTCGIGGSLLSIGSAAGVALMGQAKNQYTFISHLKWSWAILIGYFAAIICHFWFNQGLF